MNKKYKSIVKRFVKAFWAGFFTGLILVTTTDIRQWTDLGTALNTILLAGVIGGVNGVIMAGQKYFTWQE